MKNNRSLKAMLSAIWVSMTSGLRSKGFRRAVGMLLVVANLMTTTGMVLAKEMDDETQETSSGIVAAITEEPSSETAGDPSEESSSGSSDATDSSETSESSEVPETSDPSITDPDGSSDLSDSDPDVSSDATSDTESLPDDSSDGDSETSPDTSDTEAPSESSNALKDGMTSPLPDDPSLMDPSMIANENTIMKTFKGDTYSVVVAYGPETGIPSDAQLSVSEITSGQQRDGYCEKLSDVVDSENIDQARIFDISLLVNGVEVEPKEGTSVSVKIILNEVLDGNISVVHLPEDKDADVVDTTSSSTDKGMEIRFDAEGFSAYAIVPGPSGSGLEASYKRVTSLNQLAEKGAPDKGVYFGHPYGFSFTDSQFSISNTRTGISKTPIGENKVIPYEPQPGAVLYFFERQGATDSNQFKIYCLDTDGETKKYLQQNADSLKFATEANASVFTITANTQTWNKTELAGVDYTNTWDLVSNGYYITSQNGCKIDGNKGKSFAAYAKKDEWMPMCFWYYEKSEDDPYGLDGKTCALLNTKGGDAGRTLQSTPINSTNLASLQVSVVTKTGTSHQDKLYITTEENATMWTFTWLTEDKYYITDEDGNYLTITSSGLSMSTTPTAVHVIPGTGSAAGQISLMNGTDMLTFSGSADTGFNINNNNDRWLYLAEERDLTSDYEKTYSAKKISVSDPSLESGDQVIVYTRRWEYDSAKGKYEYKYYAIDHNGDLVQCYESGDYLQWTDNLINTLLWDFTIYYNEGYTSGKENENNYYELYNEYSQKYIAPQLTDGQILSDSEIGIQLDGRKRDRYYSSIVAWDDDGYAYSSVITTDQENIAAGDFSEAEDFYFAIIQDDLSSDVDLVEVDTVDNNTYGIVMKMQDFDSKDQLCRALEDKAGKDVRDELHTGILSTKLEDGYPTIIEGGASLATLFDNPTTVNHLFIESTHAATGYFEYDSTQNFASLNSSRTEFTVYQQLGTHDEQQKSTLQHGQFLPYNDLDENHYSVKNPLNLYNMNAKLNDTVSGRLPDSDPRKYERLYLVDHPNLQFGMELTASFIQTPSGLDDWGHDIIYEFTGDDDFWLYVDDELVIDLGGCHSAMAGSINFATGRVIVNGEESDLKTIFYNNYLGRDNHTAEEAQAYVDGLFVTNGKGGFVFRDYTSHTMRIFYLERGGGASNLHMKFNQSSVTPGKVVLGKKVSGIDDVDSVMAEFPYQIFYTKKDDPAQIIECPITGNTSGMSVVYRGTNDPVPFESTCTIDGVDYSNVFFLKPGEECEITFPDNMVEYKIVECAVNSDLYEHVYVNSNEMQPTSVDSNNRENYAIQYAKAKDRTNVQYDNAINPAAVRTLNIQKKLYKEDGVSELTSADVRFNFRLYLSGEYDEAITPQNKSGHEAYMYKYHVKDLNGNYCYWSSTDKDFRSLGKTVFSDLNVAEKQSATFQTSMYGSISKIPAGYTVEVKGLMVGSHYMVEERDNEVPDGYSRRDYYYYKEVDDDTYYDTSTDPYYGTMGTDVNPKVVVNNLKGYGLRVYKEWTDKDFMDSHADAFFAVYKSDGNGGYVLAHPDPTAQDAVHCIKTNKDTSYWYFEHLDTGLTLNDYVIREVELNGTYSVASNGVVTLDPSCVVTPIADGGTITIRGTMTGATTDAAYDYTVTYEQGTMTANSNVRVDHVTNDRPGLGLTKINWDNTETLQNAEFTVISTDPAHPFRKKFVSDEHGKITKAFFVEGTTYQLTEIKTPIGYYCPTDSILVTYVNGEFVIDTSASEYFGTTKVKSGDDTLLGIKNMTYSLRVTKIDATDNRPIEGAHFALHKQIKVGPVTMFDYDPVPGYEDLVSEADGLIPQLNNQLAPGTYELRETQAPLGYLPLPHNVRFVVGDTGGITLLHNYTDVSLESHREGEGVMAFEMKIKDTTDGNILTVTKTVAGNMGSRDQKFDFTVTLQDANGDPFQSGNMNARYGDGSEVTLTFDNTGTAAFQLAHGESIRLALPSGTSYSVTEAVTDYDATWKLNNGEVQTGRTSSGLLTEDKKIAFTNTKNGVIPTGIDFTVKAILGAGLLLVIGASAFAVVSRRRRDEDDPEDGDPILKGIRRV